MSTNDRAERSSAPPPAEVSGAETYEGVVRPFLPLNGELSTGGTTELALVLTQALVRGDCHTAAMTGPHQPMTTGPGSPAGLLWRAGHLAGGFSPHGDKRYPQANRGAGPHWHGCEHAGPGP